MAGAVEAGTQCSGAQCQDDCAFTHCKSSELPDVPNLQAFCRGHQPHEDSTVHEPHDVFDEQTKCEGAGFRMMIWYAVHGHFTQPSLLVTSLGWESPNTWPAGGKLAVLIPTPLAMTAT